MLVKPGKPSKPSHYSTLTPAQKRAYWKRRSRVETSVAYKYQKHKARKHHQPKPPGALSAIGEVAGPIVGGYFGGPTGAALGKAFGGKLGHLVEQITGFGDYRLNSNSLMQGGMSPAQIVNSHNKGGYIVRHREYLCDITSTTAFAIQTFALNPGMSSSFPWLSQIATSFEEYRWRGLMFEFKTLSSNAVLSSSASTSLGAVVMSTQYNSVAAPFTDKKTMENYEFANSSNPSCTFIHPVECKSSVTPVSILYTRAGQVPANADQRLYDLGEFSIATQGMQNDGGVIGELWATYECEFFKCQYAPQDMTDHFRLQSFNTSIPLGTGTNPVSGSSLGGTISNGITYNFPRNVSNGKYLVTIYWNASGQAVILAPQVGTENCTLLKYWSNGNTETHSPPSTTTSSTYMVQFLVNVDLAPAKFEIGITGVIPVVAPQNGDMWITQISQTINS